VRWWLAALGLIACSGTAPSERLPTGPATRVAQPAEEPAEAALTWASLAITGDNWQAQLATIPADQRASLAVRFLEAGAFECPALPPQPGECAEQGALRQPDAGSTLKDPCLRRLVALWALEQIDEDMITASLSSALMRIVRIPPPDRELPAAALDKMPGGFLTAAAMWEAKAAGNDELVSAHALDGFDDEDLRQAAGSFHFDEALLALDPAVDRELYLDALSDDALRPATRLQVIDLMVSLALDDGGLHDRVHRRLTELVETDDCTLAAAAQAALAELDGDRVPPVIGPFEAEADVIRAICATLGTGSRGKAWKSMIARSGLDIADHTEDPWRVDALWAEYPFAYDDDEDGVPDVPEADPDLDGNAATWKETRHMRWHDQSRLPFADELRLALPHCEDTRCPVPGTSVWFRLDIRLQRGALYRLVGIDRHEQLGSDC